MKLINITPEAYRCGPGSCPAIYTACNASVSCPTVMAKSDSYVIVGRGPLRDDGDLRGRIGKEEVALEISAVIVNEVVNAELTKRIAMLEAALKPFALGIIELEAADDVYGVIVPSVQVSDFHRARIALSREKS